MDFFIYFVLPLAIAWAILLIVFLINEFLIYKKEQIDKDLRRREAYNAVMSAKWRREFVEKRAKMKIIKKSTIRKSTQDPQGL